VDVLIANAGRGLGGAFLDQEFGKIRGVIDTNVVGTTYLLHKVVREMRNRNGGRVLITGSMAGFIPGSYQAVYNASKAYLNSLSFALREELRDTAVTVTCLLPGATETDFFRRAEMLDTKVGAEEKDDAAMVTDGIQGNAEGRERRRHGHEEQDPVRRGERHAERSTGEAAPPPRRSRMLNDEQIAVVCDIGQSGRFQR
jgi:short-subunit dehydrogenase